ncbi:hypothetical protein VY88_19890 [Azospirillum thiophilum]|uniref:Response regulatory domain-containing protein n=2 Tax=Azospirillum thiophilum TaxID=528244 RepID=A0AAC8W2U6_9PROT|nr:response regulator [Azospirillum thiophilum]ALG73921.1 hypothetical protein AL072_23025 [Azospirillum thiophilum]KJR63733.1 hypothetical protein VY88_19890 [Azospirillum thiophilum]
MATFSAPQSRGHILIVEDESGIRAAMTLVLEMEGFQVTQASDGRHGLHCLIEAVPDVVLSDYMMPYMNGIEMIREIRAKPGFQSLPIVLLTAAIPSEPDFRILIDAFLEKPVEVPILVATLQRLVDRRPSSN